MIRPFQLHRPTTLAEASRLVRELPAASVFWGGTELLQVMKLGFARFEHLVDLKSIDELRGIAADEDGGLTIGAGATHREIERSEVVRANYPALAALERHVANVRVRSMGSLGGNLCFAEPRSDPATLLLVAGASVEIVDDGTSRLVPVSEFIVDALTTVLEPGQLVRTVRLPALPAGTAIGYRRFVHAERPVAAVACRLVIDGDRVADARVAVGAAGPRPTPVPAAGAALVGWRPDDAAAGDAAVEALVDGLEIDADLGGSVEYKRHLLGVLLRRATADAWEAARAA